MCDFSKLTNLESVFEIHENRTLTHPENMPHYLKVMPVTQTLILMFPSVCCD